MQFGCKRRFGRPGRLLPLLEQLDPGQDEPDSHVALALQGSLGFDYQRVEWSVKQGALRESLVFTPDELMVESDNNTWESAPVGYRFHLEGLRGRGLAAKVLAACRWSPAQVVVNNGVVSRTQAFHQTWRALLVAHFQAGKAPCRLGVPEAHFQGFEKLEEGLWRRRSRNGLKRLLPDNRPWLQSWDGPEKGKLLFCSCRVTIAEPLMGMGRLRFVHHGVLLDELNEELGLPGVVVEVAHQPNTDLSGFGVVRDDDYQNLVAQIRTRVREAVACLRRNILELGVGPRRRRAIFTALRDSRDSYLGMIRGSYYLVERMEQNFQSVSYLGRSENRRPQTAVATILKSTSGRDLEWVQAYTRVLELQHANIVSLVDFGYEPDFYRIEAWGEGQPLDKTLARGELNWTQALSYARQLLAGLVHAHEHGVQHGNLRPGCLIVDGDTLRIRGFGWDPPGLQHQRDPFAEPDYLSPEVLMGGRTGMMESDQYCAALVIYRLLFGRSPFRQGPDPMSNVVAQVDPRGPRPGSGMPSVSAISSDQGFGEGAREAISECARLF